MGSSSRRLPKVTVEARRSRACGAVRKVMTMRTWLCALFLLIACIEGRPLRADDTGLPNSSIATSLPQNGDPAGIRKRLVDRGITFNLIYTNDVLSNLSGGN